MCLCVKWSKPPRFRRAHHLPRARAHSLSLVCAPPCFTQIGVIEKVKAKASEGKTSGPQRARTKSFHIQGLGDGRELELVPPPLATAVIKMGVFTKRGDLSGFYANLLDGRLAGDVASWSWPRPTR